MVGKWWGCGIDGNKKILGNVKTSEYKCYTVLLIKFLDLLESKENVGYNSKGGGNNRAKRNVQKKYLAYGLKFCGKGK